MIIAILKHIRVVAGSIKYIVIQLTLYPSSWSSYPVVKVQYLTRLSDPMWMSIASGNGDQSEIKTTGMMLHRRSVFLLVKIVLAC